LLKLLLSVQIFLEMQLVRSIEDNCFGAPCGFLYYFSNCNESHQGIFVYDLCCVRPHEVKGNGNGYGHLIIYGLITLSFWIYSQSIIVKNMSILNSLIMLYLYRGRIYLEREPWPPVSYTWNKSFISWAHQLIMT